ncbi:MAG: hypothetical protein WEF50_05350 [Myxococcota bacterium]
MRLAALLALILAALPAAALAQGESEYQRPAHMNADEVAILFLSGRYITPVTCKLADGSQIEVEDSVVVKAAPEQGGGKQLKATFYGIQVESAEYCYSSIERRLVNRRGVLYLHFRTRNRPEYGIADFRRMASAGPLTFNSHRGELEVRAIGAEAGAEPPRVVSFEGGDSRIVVEGIPGGTDGAKLVNRYLEAHPPEAGRVPRVFKFRVIAKDASEFVFYAIEDSGRRR